MSLFQSLLEFALSILLLLTTWTMAEPGLDEGSRAEGVLGWMECYLWKTEFLLWGLNVSSTWNIVTLTIERFVRTTHPSALCTVQEEHGLLTD